MKSGIILSDQTAFYCYKLHVFYRRMWVKMGQLCLLFTSSQSTVHYTLLAGKKHLQNWFWTVQVICHNKTKNNYILEKREKSNSCGKTLTAQLSLAFRGFSDMHKYITPYFAKISKWYQNVQKNVGFPENSKT